MRNDLFIDGSTFPRLQSRGPIEARQADRGASGSPLISAATEPRPHRSGLPQSTAGHDLADFRGYRAAAPLKLRSLDLAPQAQPHFRGYRAAAPLKRSTRRDAPRVAHFRGYRAAAPLKRWKPSETASARHFRGYRAAAPLKRMHATLRASLNRFPRLQSRGPIEA